VNGSGIVLIDIVDGSSLLSSTFNKRGTSSFIKLDRIILSGIILFIKIRVALTLLRMPILIIST
jgi:hypothetical protein